MSLLTDIGLFSLFLLRAMTYALGGIFVLGVLDVTMHLLGKEPLTKRHYAWILGGCCTLGMFLQWQAIEHPLDIVPDQSITARDPQHSNATIRDLRDTIQEKDVTIQVLKREIAVLSAEVESDSSADFSIIATLKSQLDEDQRKISSLTHQLEKKEPLNDRDQALPVRKKQE